MFSDIFWDEAGRAEIADVQMLLTRLVRERFSASTNEAIEVLQKTLDGLRVADKKPLAFLQAGEFMESVGEPPPMFAEGILPQNSLVLWTGRAKAGKSLAAYQIMEDVAFGRPIFGHFQIAAPGTVLYIGMEDGKHEINRRMRMRGMDPADKDCPIYVNTDVRDYGMSENVDELRSWIETSGIRPDLVVIDTFTESFDCVRDWNDRNQVKRAFRALRTFAQEVCTVIGIIHNVKGNAEERESGDEIAGTLAVLSSADGYLSCYKRKFLAGGNLQLSVRGGGRGGITPSEFIIEMDTATYHWRWLNEQEMEEAKRSEQHAEREKLWDRIERAFLARDGSGTVAEIASHTKLTERYVRDLIKEMITAERLLLTGDKRSNGVGKPAPVYGLTSSSNNNNGTAHSFKSSVIIPASETLVNDLLDDAEEI